MVHMNQLLPLIVLLSCCGMFTSCVSPVSGSAFDNKDLDPLAWVCEFWISLDGVPVSSSDLVIYDGESGVVEWEEENGRKIIVNVHADGTATTIFQAAGASTANRLQVKPNSEVEMLAASTTLGVKYKRQTTGEKQFEKMKSLVGEWYMAESGESDGPVVIYHMSANNTALVERLFPGNSHEMVTMYFIDRSRLALTHFCALGNQPTMIAKPGNEDKIQFDFLSATNLDSPLGEHMHDVTFVFHDENRVDATWSNWKDGKETGTHLFPFERRTKP